MRWFFSLSALVRIYTSCCRLVCKRESCSMRLMRIMTISMRKGLIRYSDAPSEMPCSMDSWVCSSTMMATGISIKASLLFSSRRAS